MARVVFDLDGTLIHSAPDIHAAANRMLAGEGIAPLDIETITSFIGNGLPHLTKLVMEATGLDMARHAELSASVLAHYNAASSELTVPYPGLMPALQVLRAQGHAMGVCTNKPEEPARAVLRDLDIGPFDAVIGGDTLPQRKPDPAPLHATFAALGGGAQLYVGDSEVDAATALAAGVPFLLYTEGYRKTPVDRLPHWGTFEHFDALPDLVARALVEAA